MGSPSVALPVRTYGLTIAASYPDVHMLADSLKDQKDALPAVPHGRTNLVWGRKVAQACFRLAHTGSEAWEARERARVMSLAKAAERCREDDRKRASQIYVGIPPFTKACSLDGEVINMFSCDDFVEGRAAVVELVHSAAKLPVRATPGSAGPDVLAAERVGIPPNDQKMVPLGFKIKPPPGTYARLAPR